LRHSQKGNKWPFLYLNLRGSPGEQAEGVSPRDTANATVGSPKSKELQGTTHPSQAWLQGLRVEWWWRAEKKQTAKSLHFYHLDYGNNHQQYK